MRRGWQPNGSKPILTRSMSAKVYTRRDMLRDRARAWDKNAVQTLAEEVREFAHPLKTSEDLDPLIERIGDAQFVLLGEASHGTSEYYQWRARLSARLISEKEFRFVAVEEDWPDCYRVNRYVKGYPESGKNA